MLAFSALADPTRFHIVEMLAKNGSMAVNEIGKDFKISPPAISQHLKVLRQANLVHVEVRAQQRLYSLNPAGISRVEDWLSETRRMWQARFDSLDALLKEEVKNQSITEGKENDESTHGTF